MREQICSKCGWIGEAAKCSKCGGEMKDLPVAEKPEKVRKPKK